VKVFSSSDISRLYGFSQRQIDGWDRIGMITPSIRSAKGKGHHRLYSVDDVLCFRFIKRLQDAGWHTKTIRTAIKNLRAILPDKDPLRDLVLLNANGSIVARCTLEDGQGILVDALSHGQLVMAFTLSALQNQVQDDLGLLEKSFASSYQFTGRQS
jgi:DNA-binding transcriptional MerR regulator